MQAQWPRRSRTGMQNPVRFFYWRTAMKHGYARGHKEMAGAYGMKKAVKPKIANTPFRHKKMTRPADVKPSHKGHA